MEFQDAGGIAHLMYYALDNEESLAPLEAGCLLGTRRGAGEVSLVTKNWQHSPMRY
jgi:hypothetical protein